MTDSRKPPAPRGQLSKEFLRQAREFGVEVVSSGRLRRIMVREPTLPRATPADVARYEGQLVALVRAEQAEGAEVEPG